LYYFLSFRSDLNLVFDFANFRFSIFYVFEKILKNSKDLIFGKIAADLVLEIRILKNLVFGIFCYF